MDVRELFDIIDSFIAGFGEKNNSDTSNAIFIANELFKIGLPLKWKGAGRLGIECLDLYSILEDVIPYPKNLEAFNAGRKLSRYNSRKLMLMASYLWNEGRSSLTDEEREEAPRLLDKFEAKMGEEEPEPQGPVVPMRTRSEKYLLILLCTKSTRRILRFLSENGCNEYTEIESISRFSVDTELRALVHFGLVRYQCGADEKLEYYEITEKGREFLKHIEAAVQMISYGNGSEIGDNADVPE